MLDRSPASSLTRSLARSLQKLQNKDRVTNESDTQKTSNKTTAPDIIFPGFEVWLWCQGKHIKYNATVGTKVSEIRDFLVSRLGPGPPTFFLQHGCKPLKDLLTLEDYNINHRDVINVCLSIRGGAEDHEIPEPNSTPTPPKGKKGRPPSQRWMEDSKLLMDDDEHEPILDTIREACNAMENDLNLSDIEWTTAEEESVIEELLEMWQGDNVTDVVVAPNRGVIRIIQTHLDIAHGAVIRYITPYHVWGITLSHEGDRPTWISPDPTPIYSLPAIADLLECPSHKMKHVEYTLALRYIISSIGGENNALIKPAQNYPIWDANEELAAYHGKATNHKGNCLACKTSNHTFKYSISKLTKCAKISCESNTSGHTTRLESDMIDFFFGRPRRKERLDSQWQNHQATEQKNEQGGTSPVSPNRPANIEQRSEPPQTPVNVDGFNTIHYNTDKQSNNVLEDILTLAAKESADAICLQETENMRWSLTRLSKRGWNLYRHHKVAILLNTHTAEKMSRTTNPAEKEKLEHIWRSDKYNSISVTLDTPEGPLMIATTYTPPGVDAMTENSPEKQEVYLAHQELNNRALDHKFAIITMDGNETISALGRIRHGVGKNNGTNTPSGNTKNRTAELSTMACYTTHMTDLHKTMNPHHYTDDKCARRKTHTHTQRGPHHEVTSKLDYVWGSKSLIHRLLSCELYDDTKLSKNRHIPRSRYHSAIITKIDWKGLWGKSPQDEQQKPFKGIRIKPGPDYSKWTPEKASEISRMVDAELHSLRKPIRDLWKGKATPENKRDGLTSILKKALIRSAKRELGTARGPPAKGHLNSSEQFAIRWDSLTTIIRNMLGHTIFGKPNPQLMIDPDLAKIRTWFSKRDLQLPDSLNGWSSWWSNRENLKTKAIRKIHDSILTDELARSDPKRFYKQVTKPLESTTITSLRKGDKILTTDEEIEDELKHYLQKMGSLPPEDQRNEKNAKMRTFPEDGRLKDMMDPITESDMLSISQQMKKNSMYGADTISPMLLKACLHTTWQGQIKPTTKAKKQDDIHKKFFNQMTAERTRLNLNLEEEKNEKTQTYIPHHARNLLLKILNLCILTRDMPASEKMNIVTGLPKSEGQVNSTDNLRPISVGPVIGRLLNKIMASRLSNNILKYKLMDEAQFAFLPGRDIHEAINSVLHCYKDSKRHNKPLYAIFYDISKAYDTIKWTSIERALSRLGLNHDFIDFVMNSLIGTKQSMKTNLAGCRTPYVEMHKTIKQGCPLAPLLFTIVMDELHSQYRDHQDKGYVVGEDDQGASYVMSRGYCDDTAILSSSLENLRFLNKITHDFFSKHGLNVNEIKTKVTGRHGDGAPLTDKIMWPATSKAFKTVPPNESIRYLGAHITLDLDWATQIGKMNAKIMHVVSCLNHGSLSITQASLLTKFVTGPVLEIGLRHADIPQEKIASWDRWLASAIAKRAGLRHANLHYSSVLAICNIPPIETLHTIAKTMHTLSTLTKPSELQPQYQKMLTPIINTANETHSHDDEIQAKKKRRTADPDKTNEDIKRLLSNLSKLGLNIRPNPKSNCFAKEKVKSTDTKSNSVQGTFNKIRIDLKDTYDMWGKDLDLIMTLKPLLHSCKKTNNNIPPALAHSTYKCNKRVYHHIECQQNDKDKTIMKLTDLLGTELKRASCKQCAGRWSTLDNLARTLIKATLCTDGSTYPGIPSGAALVAMTDDIHHKDLWGVPGFYWSIAHSDNYMAEMAGINKSIRSPAIKIDVHIPTDSLSCMQAIKRARTSPHSINQLRCSARPYLLAVLRAIEAKEKHGAKVTLEHVRSHTGARDKPSLGNSAADRYAKWQALQGQADVNSDINMMENELPFLLTLTEPSTSPTGETTYVSAPIHGDMRQALKKTLLEDQLKTWSQRIKRGELTRRNRKAVLQTIKHMWKDPSNSSIRFLLDILNQADPKEYKNGERTTTTCTRCGTKAKNTSTHRLQCPVNNDIWNKVDQDILETMGVEDAAFSLWPTELTKDISTRTADLLKRRSAIQTITIEQIKTNYSAIRHVALLHIRHEPEDTNDGEAIGPASPTQTNKADQTNKKTTTNHKRKSPPKGKTLGQQDIRCSFAPPSPCAAPCMNCQAPSDESGPKATNSKRACPCASHILLCHSCTRQNNVQGCTTCTDHPQRNQLVQPLISIAEAAALLDARSSKTQVMPPGSHKRKPTSGLEAWIKKKNKPPPMSSTPQTAPPSPTKLTTIVNTPLTPPTPVIQLARTPPDTTTSQAKMSTKQHIQRIARNVLKDDIYWHCEPILAICRTHLRTYSVLRTNALTSPNARDHRWHSTHMEDSNLGADTNDKIHFLRNSYTWIGPTNPDQEKSDIKDSTEAIATSTLPARTALLVHDTDQNTKGILELAQKTNQNTRAHIIARYQYNSINLENSRSRSTQNSNMKNEGGLILALIENHTAPGFDKQALSNDLKKHNTKKITTSSPPWNYTVIPKDTGNGSTRSSPLTNPNLTWYRTDSPIYKPSNATTPTSGSADQHDRLSGMIGHTPPDIKKGYYKCGHTIDDILSNEKIRKIQIILYNASLLAYQRYEQWKKWKQKTQT